MKVIYDLPGLTLKVSNCRVIAHFKFPQHEFKWWLHEKELMRAVNDPDGRGNIYARELELPKPYWLLDRLSLDINEQLADFNECIMRTSTSQPPLTPPQTSRP